MAVAAAAAAAVAAATDVDGADRFGLGWRPEIGAGILRHRDRIDLVEVVADDWFDASRRQRDALRTLAAQVPVVLHGVGLGMASASPVDERRLDAMARVVAAVEPAFWSEHLAFVRAGGIEIGHLAAPPRCTATIDGLARNVERARRVVGARPLVENVATLVDPPGSTLDEPDWVAGCLRAADAGWLLDLHNLHANAVNFGFDAAAALDRMPLERVVAIHLAGGRRLAGGRVLDDHLHAVPDPVYALLAAVGIRAPQPLTVLLERDGAYPAIEVLLAELDRGRAALAQGRARSMSDVAARRAA